MKSKFASSLISLATLSLITGCSVTSHPDYQQTYFKVSIAPEKLEQVRLNFKAQGLPNAEIFTDNLGRAQLGGAYSNEREVNKAFQIAIAAVGANNMSLVRPSNIETLDWEIEASKEFAKFIEEIAKKYSMSVDVQLNGKQKLISVNERGLAGVEQFAFASPRPTPQAAEFYQQMGLKIISSSRDTLGGKRFLIVGHTDDVGDSGKNATLSEQRARSIAQILQNTGVPAANIYYQGAGETLPIADNRTDAGRQLNRRVELTELSSSDNLSQYLKYRQPMVGYYRYTKAASSSVAQTSTPQHTASINAGVTSAATPTASTATTQTTAVNSSNMPTTNAGNTGTTSPQNTAMTAPTNSTTPEKTMHSVPRQVNFGGKPYSTQLATLDVGGLAPSKSIFSLITSAHAENMNALSDCTLDRPRIAGNVKSLQTDASKEYKAVDFAPSLFGMTWASNVNDNLVVLNRVYVLQDNYQVPSPPQLKVYAHYTNNQQTPDLSPSSQVNSYRVGNGILYRIFPQANSGMSCVDILFPPTGETKAKAGKIIYASNNTLHVVDFKPELVR